MKNVLLALALLATGAGAILAQNIALYQNSSNTEKIELVSTVRGTTTTNATNPDTDGINSNTKVTKVVTTGEDKFTYLVFNSEYTIANFSNLNIKLNTYLDVDDATLDSQNSKVVMILRNIKTGALISREATVTQAREWQRLTFNFSDYEFSDDVMNAGGFDQIRIGFAKDIVPITFYVDRILSTLDFTEDGISGFSGSWGIRIYTIGGAGLDESTVDYLGGANQVASELTSLGHVMLNLSGTGGGYYGFVLREHPYIDVASIYPAMVPSLENESQILDMIEMFKNRGVKVLLYVATGGPEFRDIISRSPEYAEDWQNFYLNDPRFTGTDDEKHGQAWRLLCRGFFERLRDAGVDGYWLDQASDCPGGVSEFAAMMREVDSNVIIASNTVIDNDVSAGNDEFSYFTDADGNYLYVDTDGLDDTDERDYLIKAYRASNDFMDMTGGHPTPLQSGASPSSWAYEEFTIPEMTNTPFDTYDGSKLVLRHAYVPFRDNWTATTANLMFNEETAYRFVRTMTDGGACMTWSTTTRNSSPEGYVPAEEMTILKEIDRKMNMSVKPDYVPYVRPQGAFLVGEEQWFPWYENEVITNDDYISQYWAANGQVKENLDNPFKTGINESEKVTRFLRDGNNPAKVFFNLPNPITDFASFKISLDAFLNIPLSQFDTSGYNLDTRIRVYLSSSKTGTTIYKQLNLSTRRVWENLVFNFNGTAISDEVGAAGGFDQMSIGFANGDTNGYTSIYYFDNVQGTINQNVDGTASKVLISNEIATSDFIDVYPNPMVTSFSVANNEELKSATIYSLSGKKIKEFSTAQEAYDIKELSSGVYILKVVTEQASIKVIRILKE